MHIVLFLGSGVSLASGLPSVPEIRGVLDIEARKSQDPRLVDLLDIVEKLDKNYIKNSAPYKTRSGYSYSGQIFRTQTSYEDLFYLLNQIRLSSWGLSADASAGALSDLVRRHARGFLKGRSSVERAMDLAKLSNLACQLIERSVANRLFFSGDVQGLDVVKELARSPRIERLDVVTLNHDVLVEKLFVDNGIVYSDGFSTADGDVRWFKDASLLPGGRVRIIKPHGSINWYASGDYMTLQPVDLLDRDSKNWRNKEGNIIQNLQHNPSFLTGTSKSVLYNRGIFANMIFQFQQSLRESKMLIMSGYGWSDTPINFHIQYWMERDSQNNLLLLHKHPRSLVDGSKELSEIADAYTANRQLIFVDKWLMESSIDEILSAINV
ncbi:MAG: SIR2 family protein [Roseomonas sp.]|nr:SIR2 family protein [Roseomonas sp.]